MRRSRRRMVGDDVAAELLRCPRRLASASSPSPLRVRPCAVSPSRRPFVGVHLFVCFMTVVRTNLVTLVTINREHSQRPDSGRRDTALRSPPDQPDDVATPLTQAWDTPQSSACNRTGEQRRTKHQRISAHCRISNDRNHGKAALPGQQPLPTHPLSATLSSPAQFRAAQTPKQSYALVGAAPRSEGPNPQTAALPTHACCNRPPGPQVNRFLHCSSQPAPSPVISRSIT